MGQIARRKKKGRPTKADLAAEKRKQKKKAAAAESELRRSGRRRNVRYTFDFDDYLFDDEDDEDERRREKKLKLLLKLHSSEDAAAVDSPHVPLPTSAPSSPASSSSAEEDDKPSKKRKIDGGGNDDEVYYENDDDNNADYSQDVDNVEVKRRKKGEAVKDLDSAPGTPSEPPPEMLSGFPLPEKKTLELILDKLQKKDIYGVYAEPVDLEELPDYHDVIKHPMDFSTIRSKLAKGSYANLEQFESDVFLICSNAMQYNAPDTIYYKQARNIQELAKKKFEKIRIKNERSERELMLDHKLQSTSILKKQIKKPLRRVQENVASDFSSGTTLATAGDIQNCSNAAQGSGIERAGSLDGLAEGSPYVIDTSLDKIEEVLPGRGLLSRFGRKLAMHDENRATYNTSTEPVASSESIFSTFDGEIKQLIPVGLYVDHSYVRSLARFAGTLGPIAWQVASKRIEQVVPTGTKFGRGWVGEYEPPPTPVVMLENCTIKEPAFFMKPQHNVDTRKNEKHVAPVASSNSSIPGPTLDGKLSFFSPPGTKVTTSSRTTTTVIAKEPPVRGTNSGGKQSFFCSPRTTHTGSASSHLQHQNSQTRHLTDSEAKVQKQVELNSPAATNQRLAHLAVEGQVSNGTEVLTPRSVEMVSMNKNLLPSGSFKQPNTSGVAIEAVPNEKMVTNNLDGSRVPVSSSDMGKVPTYSPRGQAQGLSDPVELMRMLNGKNQNQQKFVNQSAVNVPPVPSPAQSLSREEPSNAAAAAARVWMSIGAGGLRPAGGNMSPHKNQISADSLYNPTRAQLLQMSPLRGDSPTPALHIQPERNGFPFHGFVPEPARVGSIPLFQNRPMVFPQLLPTDFSRFPMQSPWRNLSPQTQQGQKQETVPPDLNVSFQSSGSPGRPSSGILVDSQQPDLALQL